MIPGSVRSLEKEMATHSSILAWEIPWTQEPGGLESTGSQSQTRLSNFTNYGGSNEDNGDLFQKDLCQHALAPRTVAVSAPDPETGHSQPTPPLETPGCSQTSLGQSLVGSLLLSPRSWCPQGFVCAL